MSGDIFIDTPLAFGITIPCLDGAVYVLYRDRSQQLMELRISFVYDFLLQAIAKLRHIRIKPYKLYVTRVENSISYSRIALNSGIFIIGIFTRISI